MVVTGLGQLGLPGGCQRSIGTRLWREWCFLRVVLRHVSLRVVLLVVLLLIGGLLFQRLEPEKHHSLAKAMYYTWALVFAQAPEDFPDALALQVMFFVVPALGLAVILEAIVDCALILRDRRRNERSWCKVMAASLSNHVIQIGLGKLGYRVFCLLRQLGQQVAVIERNAGNQFLEDVRRDGSPLFIGDARREALLGDAHAATARCIILATNDDLANLEIALDARRINPRIRVVLRMFDQNMADKIKSGFNLQVAMSQSAISAPAFVLAALERPVVSSLMVDDQLVVMERWPVQSDSVFCGRTVGEIMAAHALAVVEHRPATGPRRLFPAPDVRVASGDEVLVQGLFESLRRLRGQAVEPDTSST